MRSKDARLRKDWSRLRIVLLAAVLGMIWMGLWGRAYMIQLVHGVQLSESSKSQYWTKDQVRGNRGDIRTARGSLLAKSVVVHSVFARPREIEDPGRVSRLLSRALESSRSELESRVQRDAGFVWIERKIGDRAAANIRTLDLKGIYLTEESRRIYPQGRLAGQLLGFVGMDGHGLEGLELEFDSRLAGEKRQLLVQRDAYGRVLYAPGELSGRLSGEDLMLTLDTRVQYGAEKAVKRAVRKYGADYGMALVVKVDNGHILASAQYPFFDPNNFRRYSPRIWRHRAALDPFEPGSTAKPFLVAAALEEGICAPKSIYFCENSQWQVEGKLIEDSHAYGWLPVRKIIKYSSNIGAGKIGLDLQAKPYYTYLQRLGLGRETGLPFPSENEGILREPHKWNRFELVSASFGQGFSLNLYQMARAYLCLANKGVSRPLRLVAEPARERREPERIFSRQTGKQILGMLESVVQDNGTGTRADIEGVSLGGKTGTAQKAQAEGGYGEQYIAAFAGLMPAEDPEYLLLAVVENPSDSHYGGVVAAPAVRSMGRSVLTHSEEFRDKMPATLYAENSTRDGEESEGRELVTDREPERAKKRDFGSGVPDVRGMALRSALELLAENGVVPRVKGRGTVVAEQSPDPGSSWGASEAVLRLASPGRAARAN